MISSCSTFPSLSIQNTHIQSKPNPKFMGVTKTSKSYCSLLNLIIILCTCSLVFTVAKSEVIVVGGENRWTDGFNYVSWAQQFNFTVGDVLVFRYTSESHNVYEVTRETFQSCDTRDGVIAMYDSGNDQVVLQEAKQYWFICTVDQHCQLGMKFGINVSAATTNITQLSSSSNIQNSASSGIFIYLLALSFLSLLFTTIG